MPYNPAMERRERFTQDHINLPYWAKSSNPIVRRHLGLYWRTVPPEIRPIMMVISAWIAIFILASISPALFAIVAPLSVASLLVMPVVLLIYGHVLVTVAVRAADVMQQEMRNNTLLLLRVTPMRPNQIILGKVAASIWKRMEDIALLAMATAIFAPPVLLTSYSVAISAEEQTILLMALVVIGTIVSVLRIFIEVIWVGTLAVLIGLSVPYRSTTLATSVAISAIYFVLINLVRQLPGAQDTIAGIVLVDFVLPLVVPLVLIALVLWVTKILMTQD